jgi:hypothetical protein
MAKAPTKPNPSWVATAAQKAAISQAASTYDPTRLSANWAATKQVAKTGATPLATPNPNANAGAAYNPVTGQFDKPVVPQADNPATTGGGAGPTGGGAGPTGGGAGPADLTSGSSGQDTTAWNITNDPTYQMGMLQGQSAFNTARANALASMQNQTTGLNRQYAGLEQNAQIARRNLAGNFAARGMGRGDYGAQYRAMDQMNAQEITAQTDIKDQISALNQNFLSNYGAVGTDWTGTTAGQGYQNTAIQQALAARLAQYGVK